MLTIRTLIFFAVINWSQPVNFQRMVALQTPISTLGDLHRDSRNLRCYAGTHTTAFARGVQSWRRPANKISVGRPTVANLAVARDFAIVAPKATVAPGLCAKLLLAHRPFACLLPLDLLHVVSVRHDGKFDTVVRKLLGHSSRVAFPLVNLFGLSAVLFSRMLLSCR